MSFEGEILLRQVTENDYNTRGDDFCNGGIDVEFLNEQADKAVIQQNTKYNQQEIPKKLDSAVETGTGKHDIAHQQESCWKADQEGHHKSGDIGFECQEANMQYLFMQDKIIADKKNQDIQDGIGSAAGGIAESLYGHQLSEGRVEKINKRDDLLFWHKFRGFPREGNIKDRKIVPDKYYFCSQFIYDGTRSPDKARCSGRAGPAIPVLDGCKRHSGQ
jgi:hypothetical protein